MSGAIISPVHISSVFLVPLLYSSKQFKLKTLMRSRDVYDMKLIAEPRGKINSIQSSKLYESSITRCFDEDSGSELPDAWVKPNFTPNEKCVMCRELYFFPLRKDVHILDEWYVVFTLLAIGT